MKNVLFKIVLLLAVVVSVGILGCEKARDIAGDYGVDTFQSDSATENFLKGTWNYTGTIESGTMNVDGNKYEIQYSGTNSQGNTYSGADKGTLQANTTSVKFYQTHTFKNNSWQPASEEMIISLEIISDTEFILTATDGSAMIFTR